MGVKKLKWYEKKSAASYTVEYAMVMPLVILCICLLVLINLYLHDEVVMNGAAAEAVYSSLTEDEMNGYLKAVSGSRCLLISQPSYSCNRSMVEERVSWKCTFSLPLRALFSEILQNQKVTIGGEWERYPWNMAQVLRIKSIIESKGDI